MKLEPTLVDVRLAAMNLLAQREHSIEELRQKLAKRFDEPALIIQAVAQLAQEGLQSDERFAEAFVTMRVRQGKGPVRIGVELRAKGIEPARIESLLADDDRWLMLAGEVRSRRFGSERVDDPRERARQARFLQYRGFTAEQIQRVLR